MRLSLKMQSHNPVALRFHDQIGSKIKYTFIQAHRAWLPKFLLMWILLMGLISWGIYSKMDDVTKIRRKDVLGSLCDQRARMLQDQFSVSVNHVHALAILVSTFHYYRYPSAIDQVCAPLCITDPDPLQRAASLQHVLYIISALGWCINKKNSQYTSSQRWDDVQKTCWRGAAVKSSLHHYTFKSQRIQL